MWNDDFDTDSSMEHMEVEDAEIEDNMGDQSDLDQKEND